jgi:hypothetical protein
METRESLIVGLSRFDSLGKKERAEVAVNASHRIALRDRSVDEHVRFLCIQRQSAAMYRC